VAEPAHWLHARYFDRALGRLLTTPPGSILDAGCGAGDYSFYLAQRFPEARVLGVDLNAELIAKNRAIAAAMGLENVTFEVADLATFSGPGRFDLICSIDVLEHIPEQSRAIENLVEALRPSGIMFCHLPTIRERPVPLHRWLKEFHAWAEQEHIADERTAQEFLQIIQGAGLQVLEHTRTFGYWTGELATSLFALPYRNTAFNRVIQLALVPICRLLTLVDSLGIDSVRYGLALAGRHR
jgi:trans-aconitate methyltransferase